MILPKILFSLIGVLLCNPVFCQSSTILYPTLAGENNYSEQESKKWQGLLLKWQSTTDESTYEKLSAEEKRMMDQIEEGNGPLTNGVGCSWYCGGEMTKVASGSHLKQQGATTYIPKNIHDFNLFTAWVPDTAGGPVGKKIAFHFAPLSPRVSEIIIYNGYLKNSELFQAHARVKTFRLYLNGAPYATLKLTDTTAAQTFKIAPVRSNKKGKDLVLELEILEVYPGSKYREVAVSEINFNGLDVH